MLRIYANQNPIGNAGSSGPDVSVQGQHGMSRTGSVRIALGMGSASAGVEELGVYHSRRARQEPRGSVGGSESGCTIGDRRSPGQAPGIRLPCFQLQAAKCKVLVIRDALAD